MKFLDRYLKNKKKEKHNLRKINATVEALVYKNFFHSRAMLSNDRLTSSEPNENDLVVSLTTYSKRIHEVYLVIESIGFQTLKADKIVLWLDQQEFNIDTIPLLLRKQITRGLEVKFCSNLKSYKKLIPSLIEFPNSDIITIDDDFLYPHDLIEQLVKAKTSYPNTIIGVRAHTITVENGKPLPYKKWRFEDSFKKNGAHTFLTTGAGTIFPANINYRDLTETESFMALSPTADDVWVNLICIKNNINRMKVHDDRKFSSRFLSLDSNQDMALNNKNVHENQNDKQVENILQTYPMVM